MSIRRPIWLGDDRHASFGWWHGPSDGGCRAGVVICPPLGIDYPQSHYALRRLGEELARAGFCAVRLDYDGTGDSAGSDQDPDRVPAWLGTIGAAASLLRSRGAPAICLVGMRSGATLGAHAAAADGAVDQVVLWDPVVSGKAFLSEQRALGGVTLGIAPSRGDGSLEIPGSLYGPTTVRDLERLGITNCPRPLARRVLVLTRRDHPNRLDQARSSLALEELSCSEASGQHELMELGPPFQQLPNEAIRRIVTWLSAGARGPTATAGTPPPAGTRVVGDDGHGRRIYEAPVSLPPVGLFGIMTLAEGVDPPGSTPTALLFNNGTHHRVGPSRAWVDLARRWAKAGIPSVRIDLSGMGDSPTRDPADTSWTCSKPEAFDDVADATRWASPDDPTNVFLVGLCSSGYQVLESALGLGARGVVAINPGLAFVPPERSVGQPIYKGRRIALPLDAIADTFREGGRLGWLRDVAPNLAWRTRILLCPRHRSGRWLADLTRQGTDTLLVCGDGELRPVRNGVTGIRLRRLASTGMLHLVHLEGLQHSLLVAEQREVVLDLVTDHVLARFAPQLSASRGICRNGHGSSEA